MRLLIALMILTAATGAAYQPDYFPLHPGNQWIYEQHGATAGDPVVIEVVRVEVFDNRPFALVRGFPSGEVWLRLEEDGTLAAWDPEQGRTRPWVAFGAAENEVFPTEITDCNNSGQVVSKSASLSSKIGEFQNAFEVSYSTTCADAGLTGEFYLPYIGLVRRTETTIAGPLIWDLIYAQLGAITYVAAPELSFQLALSQTEFEAGGDPMELIARITLRNRRLDPVEITFPSTQRFDLAIRNEEGQTVYTWSADKLFAEVITREEFPNGETNWAVKVDPGAQSGPLRPGVYTVEAWLASQPPARYSATSTFVVREAQGDR